MDSVQTTVSGGVPATHPRHMPWSLVAVVGLLLVAAAVAAVVLSRSGDPTYARTSPQFAVQRYVQLLQDGKVDTAYGMTDTALTRQEFHDRFDNWSSHSHTVTLVRSSAHAGNAVVIVDIESFSGGPFGSSNNTNRTTFTLTRYKKVWRISGPDYFPY